MDSISQRIHEPDQAKPDTDCLAGRTDRSVPVIILKIRIADKKKQDVIQFLRSILVKTFSSSLRLEKKSILIYGAGGYICPIFQGR